MYQNIVFLDTIWEILTSKNALYIYIVIFLLILIVLIVRLMINERTRELADREEALIGEEAIDQNLEKKLLKHMDGGLDSIRSEVMQTKSMVTGISEGGINITGSLEDTIITNPAKALALEESKRTDDPEEVNTSDSRFYMLKRIDEIYAHYVAPEYNNKINLKDFCDKFRNYNCYARGLYYDIKDIRRFVAGMAVTKLIILQGMSGTGKTSLAVAMGAFIDNQTTVVPIQPMWKERTDLIGYYNEFTRKFNETTLLNTMYDASNNKEVYITVLDEMNIARVEYYFAEFLSLLELPDENARMLDVVNDEWKTDPKLLQKGKLKLPKNMWFIGTANNDDSTFAISDKVYDRAMVLNLDTKAEIFEAEETKPIKISIDHLEALFKKAEKEYAISDRNLRRIAKLDQYLIQTFHLTFGNRIMKQIRTYVPVLVACGGSELDALDDILSRKVLRKLESKNPVYVRSQADNLCNYLDDLFGQDKMALCKEAIRSIEQNV